jgi:hypothetical protein
MVFPILVKQHCDVPLAKELFNVTFVYTCGITTWRLD